MDNKAIKTVIILSSSPRKGGNSDVLCDEFMRGALESGNSVEKIRLVDKDIAYCKGCYYCRTSGGVCAVKDDMSDLLTKIINADVIVLATPVYFNSFSAQLKTVIDRTVARWKEVKNKDFYLIVTCGENDMSSCEITLTALRGYLACVSGAKERGIIRGVGVYDKGQIRNTDAIFDAYKMGKSV